jgi:site-specific recombinase XerC
MLPEALSVEQVRRLLDVPGGEQHGCGRAMFELLYSSGLRLEIVALDRRRPADLKQREVAVTGEAPRPAPCR